MLAQQSYNKGVAVVTSDTVNFSPPLGIAEAIYVGGAGIVVAVLQDDSVINFTCVAGQILPVRVLRVNATSTTATLMVALYNV